MEWGGPRPRVVVVVFIASFTQLFPTAEAYDRRRGQDPNARFGDDTDGPEGIHGDGPAGADDKPPDTPAKPTDPFETLGLDKTTATVDDVARAFKKMAIKWHPDKNRDGNEEEAVRMMQTVNAVRCGALGVDDYLNALLLGSGFSRPLYRGCRNNEALF